MFWQMVVVPSCGVIVRFVNPLPGVLGDGVDRPGRVRGAAVGCGPCGA